MSERSETRAEPSARQMALAGAIRAVRGGRSQTDLAELLGRPQSVISTWETGAATPSLEALRGLEAALGLPLGVLASWAGYFEAPDMSEIAAEDYLQTNIYCSLDDAVGAVRAAEVLGFATRMTSPGVEGWSTWTVDVLYDATDVDDDDLDR